MKKKFYITTPIYYANSLPHLGHLYTTVVADTVHRFKEQRGYDVLFLTGTDEHGINIQRAAEHSGRTPKEQVDFITAELKRMFSDFRLDTASGGYDIFMRTSEPFHYRGASEFWRRIAAGRTPRGRENIYKGYYEGWFCAPCASFKFEDEFYVPEGSETPLCRIHERPLDKVSEESYFFRLSDYEEFLIQLIDENPGLIRPEVRRNETLAFIRRGLQDLSISRLRESVSWGIPVPGDEKHVMYVWLDALSNYITALGFGSDDETRFKDYWPHAVHLVGKDILRFHTVYWFSFLKAAGITLPQMVYAHGMWLDAEGRKMGKTLGNVIEIDVLHRLFPVESIRYFLLREMVFGQDGKFGYENLVERVNADLAGGLGNLFSRTISMIAKYRNGRIPDGKISEENYIKARRAQIDPDGVDLVSALAFARDEFVRRFENYDFSGAIEAAWGIIARTDKMISDSKPWELAKDPEKAEVLSAVLYRSAEVLRWLSVMLSPVMPDSMCQMYSRLGCKGKPYEIDPADLVWGGLVAEAEIGDTIALFPRLDREKIMEEIKQNQIQQKSPVNENKVADKEENKQPSDADFITIDDFARVELRVGEILVAERVPNADKLLRFEIDLGEGKPRQILAGLAEYYDPQTLIGRKVAVVANLKPRKMRGLESQGMILAASFGDGDKPAIATFTEDVRNGARLK